MKRPKNRSCEECGKPSVLKLCSFHMSRHDPTPEHHVAAERLCLRCDRPFPSAWSGDRVCTLCRTNEDSQDKQAIQRGQTSRTYDSPFEPVYTPGVV